eukprot:4002953-Amphidinium_carterae.4
MGGVVDNFCHQHPFQAVGLPSCAQPSLTTSAICVNWGFGPTSHELLCHQGWGEAGSQRC